MDLEKKIAKKKMELGRARKVLWQYRDEDLEDEIVAVSITHLEEMRIDLYQLLITNLLGDAVEDNEYTLKVIDGEWWIEHKHVGSAEPLIQFLKNADKI